MRFEVSFRRSDQQIAVKMHTDKTCFNTTFSSVQPATVVRELEPYTGAYTVTPMATAQTLKTAQKRMTQDFTIREIPYYTTSNPQQGVTVYIGSEVDIYGG